MKEMALIVEGEASAIVVPEGAYQMELANIEAVDGKFGKSFKWFWKGDSAEQGEFELSMMTSARLTPATKAGRCYTVLNRNVQIGVGEKVDLEKYVGCLCEVLVRNKTNDDGITYSNVVELVRLVDDSNTFIAGERRKEESSEDAPFLGSNAPTQTG
jgi:hypothetical protein